MFIVEFSLIAKIYIFVLCIVKQLCNVNQQNALFKLMFQFSSSCLLHVSNILCSSSERLYCTCSLIWFVFMHLCKQSTRLKDVHGKYTI